MKDIEQMSDGFKVADSAQELLEEARRITGIDIIDTDAVEPLTALVASYNEEARLNRAGANQMRKWLLRYLVNRLRMQRDFKAHPEIADIALKPPVIISCIPRTGSTKLQKLLAASGDFNNTLFWMVFNPSSVTGVPKEDPAPRIADSDDFTSWLNNASPLTRAGHEFSTHEPDEDAFIMGGSLRSPFLSAFANCPSYGAWYGRQSRALQYFHVRAVLKYFIWQGIADPNKPFLLKTAYNSGLEDAFLAVFPDAHVLIPHRNPVASVPSMARLLAEVYRGAFSDHHADISALPAAHAKFKQKEMAYRLRHPEKPFLDLSYSNITKAPEKIAVLVYAFCGLELTPTALQNIRQWDLDNPQNKGGNYEYRAQDYGFNDDYVREQFADYTAAYGKYF